MDSDRINLHELYHHGIKGQKWGVRRYQNSDGSFTAEGKKRKNSYDTWSEDAKETSTLRKKSIHQMTNAELRKLNERLNLERQYTSLQPSTLDRGLKYVQTANNIFNTTYNAAKNIRTVVKIGKQIVNAYQQSKAG